MGTININPQFTIFDDPEYCGSGNVVCDHYAFKKFYCNLFSMALSYDNFNSGFGKHLKCDECKKHWHQSKHNKQTNIK